MAKHKDDIEKEDGSEDEAKKSAFSLDLTGDTKRSVAAVFCFVFTLLFILGYVEQAGMVGKYLDLAAATVFGWGKWLFPILLIMIGLVLLRRKIKFYVASIIGLSVTYISMLGLFHVFYDQEQFLTIAKSGEGGGMIGYFLATMSIKLAGFIGALALLFAFFIVGILVAYNFSLIPFVEKISALIQRKKVDKNTSQDDEEDMDAEENDDESEEEEDDDDESYEEGSESIQQEKDTMIKSDQENALNISNIRFDGEGTPNKQEKDGAAQDQDQDQESENTSPDTGERKSILAFFKKKNVKKEEWKLPPVDLLVKMSTKPNSGNVQAKQESIQKTLQQFDITVESEGYKIGPTVTQYRFRPAPGVRLEKILALSNNLSMELAAHPIRIEAPIPGKSLIGIEVPNKSPAYVNLREKIQESSFIKKSQSKLTLVLGKDVSGEYVLGNLDKMPHLLVAGSTNSGKSVCINALLLSLLYQCTPNDLKLILIDPKRVELSLYEGIPHLITPVIVENKKAVRALKWAVGEMERRLKILSELKSRDIGSYNEKIEKRKSRNPQYDEYEKLPYIVLVIDELSDLMMTNGKDIEGAIVRLAQMARAVGLHLIVSTQKPIANVITSLIKSNITTRIAFKVPTQIDSRTILDKGGAERLLGKGDMLYSTANASDLRRIQGVLVTEKEVKKVVDFLREQKLDREEAKDELEDDEEEDEAGDEQDLNLEEEQEGEHEDALFGEAKDVVMQEKKASTSLLQRRLRIGYNRAARLIDELEAEGIIGPQNGSKPRDILIEGSEQEEDESADDQEEEAERQKERDSWQA